jgi:ubiquinone/menaquinone biosynthesis C-methylase UbiE
MSSKPDEEFTRSIADVYERLLVPLIFDPYAQDLARRLVRLQPQSVLEIAAGTGVATRRLSKLLAATQLTATDLSPAMLSVAEKERTARPVRWQQADALQLPFVDESFDAVVCQFGAMFFPDKPRGFSEARRVLKPGGVLIFSVWDRLEANQFTDVVSQALATLYPQDPPQFMARTPHGYYDADRIRADLAAAGFTASVQFETITHTSHAESARIAATALCQGTPLRNEIETRDAARVEEATGLAAEALVRRFGAGAIEGKIQAIIVSVTK